MKKPAPPPGSGPRITPQFPARDGPDVTLADAEPDQPPALGEEPDVPTDRLPALQPPEGEAAEAALPPDDVVLGELIDGPALDEGVPLGPAESLFDRSAPVLTPEEWPIPVAGLHRVSVHLLDGRVKRGVLREPDLSHPELLLHAASGAYERVERDHIKAIFFILPPEAREGAASGDRVRVTLRDRRQVSGFSSDHRSLGAGFFVVMGEARTSMSRVFIYRHAIIQVIREA